MHWILILMVHAGIWSHNDDVAFANVPGFINEESCKAAGNKAVTLGSGTKQEVTFVCVSQ